MSRQTQAIMIKQVGGVSDASFAEAINGAFVNAELKRQLMECKAKADAWDLHQEVVRLRQNAILQDISVRKNRNARRKTFGKTVKSVLEKLIIRES